MESPNTITPETFRELVSEVARLVEREANPRKRTLSLSPETAARLQAITTASSSTESRIAIVRETPIDAADLASIVSLDALAKVVSECRQCRLCEGRTQTVFGVGNPNADLVFVGEAPGENEDLQGIPFVGRAGQLLTDIIVKGMRMQRADVYICNVIKCRPPDNRDPSSDEKKQCEPHLVRQLELLRPKVICALGAHAAKTLLRTEASTTSLRGRWHRYEGIPLRVTYHPAYLLRDPGKKKEAWEDIQEVMKFLNGETAG